MPGSAKWGAWGVPCRAVPIAAALLLTAVAKTSAFVPGTHMTLVGRRVPHAISARAPRLSPHRLLALAASASKGLELNESEFDKGDADPVQAQLHLASLVSREEIQKFVAPSDAEGFAQLAWHAGSFLLCALAWSAAQTAGLGFLATACMVAMGFVASFNFMPLHECVHRSAFKTRALNDAVMHVAGFLTMRPAQHYFYYHWAHREHQHI